MVRLTLCCSIETEYLLTNRLLAVHRSDTQASMHFKQNDPKAR